MTVCVHMCARACVCRCARFGSLCKERGGSPSCEPASFRIRAGVEGIWDCKLNGVPGGPHSLHPKCTVAKSALAQQAPDKWNFSGPDEKRDLGVDLALRGPSLQLPQSPTLSLVGLGARDVSRTDRWRVALLQAEGVQE